MEFGIHWGRSTKAVHSTVYREGAGSNPVYLAKITRLIRTNAVMTTSSKWPVITILVVRFLILKFWRMLAGSTWLQLVRLQSRRPLKHMRRESAAKHLWRCGSRKSSHRFCRQIQTFKVSGFKFQVSGLRLMPQFEYRTWNLKPETLNLSCDECEWNYIILDDEVVGAIPTVPKKLVGA